MGGDFLGIPAGVWAAAWTALVAVSTWYGKHLLRRMRTDGAREFEEIRQLRKALDRLRRRENAYATGFEIILMAIPNRPTREQRRAVQRSRELFEIALVHIDGEGNA